jgi:hypothetical protein
MDTFYLQTVPPCTECLITNIQVGLEYPNGAQANANTNLRLHHALITNLERDSVTCPMLPEPVFASGNERTEANICLNGFASPLPPSSTIPHTNPEETQHPKSRLPPLQNRPAHLHHQTHEHGPRSRPRRGTNH